MITVWFREPTSTFGSSPPESDSLRLSSEERGEALFLGSFSYGITTDFFYSGMTMDFFYSGITNDFFGLTEPLGSEATETLGGGSSES